MAAEKRIFSPIGLDELIAGWLIHAHKARDRHDEAARRYAKGQFALGIPTLIVSTVVGTSVFASLSSEQIPPWWVGLLSLLAAVLSALQTFVDFGGRSDRHRTTAVKYKSAIRSLEQAVVHLRSGSGLSDDDIAALRSRLDELEDTAPVVMPRIYGLIEKKYQDMKYVSEAIGLYSSGRTLEVVR